MFTSDFRSQTIQNTLNFLKKKKERNFLSKFANFDCIRLFSLKTSSLRQKKI